MDLLQITVLAKIAAAIDSGCRLADGLGLQALEKPFRERDNRLVLDPPGGGKDHRLAAVCLLHVTHYGFARHILDNVGKPQDRPSEWLIGKGSKLKMIENDIVRRVVGLPDFLQNNSALACQLVGIEG